MQDSFYAVLILFQLPISMLLAYLIDKMVGDPLWLPHPVVYIGKLITWLESFIRKIAKTPRALKLGGLLLWIVTVVGVYLLTAWLVLGAFCLHFAAGFILQTLLMWTAVAAKCLDTEAQKVRIKIEEKDLAGARIRIGYLVGRDTTQLSEKEIIRAAVETVAENTVDGVTAPLFYALLGGAPLMLAYKAVNTLDSMVGYKNEKYKDLGYFSAKLDDLANYIPARISLIGFILGAGLLGYDHDGARRIALRDHKNHKSPNAGWPEAAVAGALGVQLGGANIYFGEVVEKPTIGDKGRELEAQDILRAGRLMQKSSAIMLLLYVATSVMAILQRYSIFS